jgi:RNA polymerase sigma-70 factor (ECF subfamily)
MEGAVLDGQQGIGGCAGGRQTPWPRAALATERHLARRKDAFPDLYSAYAPRLRQRLRRVVRDECLVEDLLQQTFMQVYGSRRRFSRSAPVGPWVIRIAERLVSNELRRERTERRALGALSHAGANPFWRTAILDDLIDAKALARRIGDKLDGFPPSHRLAFQLVRQQGVSVAEASRELRMSIPAVRMLLHRASTALHEGTTPSAPTSHEASRRSPGPRHALNTESTAPHFFASPTVDPNHSMEVSP